MPAPKFWAHVQMMQRLQAEEALLGINHTIASNDRAFDDQSRRGLMRELETAASGGEREKAAQATPGQLANMGIKMTVVKG